VLEKMGAKISMGDDWIESRAPARGKLKAIDADLNHIPDAAMTAAVVALFAEGRARSEHRQLARQGNRPARGDGGGAAQARRGGRGGRRLHPITPPAALRSATIDTYDDHRMAMSFSLAAVGGVKVRHQTIRVRGQDLPEYFDVLASISRRVPA